MQKISFALAMLLTFTGALTLESQQSEYDYYNLAQQDQQDEDSLVADVEVEAEDIPDFGVFAPFVADPPAEPL